jgi:hypothetical protein
VAKPYSESLRIFPVDWHKLASHRPKRTVYLLAYLQHLREENYRLASDIRGKDLIIAQQEAELHKLRGAAFLQPSWNADIDSDLLKVLKTGPIHDHRLLATLGANDTESARAISRQLQILEASGFISKTSRGWCWKK